MHNSIDVKATRHRLASEIKQDPARLFLNDIKEQFFGRDNPR